MLIERHVLKIKTCFCNICVFFGGCVCCSFLYSFKGWHVGQIVGEFDHLTINMGKGYTNKWPHELTAGCTMLYFESSVGNLRWICLFSKHHVLEIKICFCSIWGLIGGCVPCRFSV